MEEIFSKLLCLFLEKIYMTYTLFQDKDKTIIDKEKKKYIQLMQSLFIQINIIVNISIVLNQKDCINYLQHPRSIPYMVEYCNKSIKCAMGLLTVFKNIHYDTYDMQSKGNKYNEDTTSDFYLCI